METDDFAVCALTINQKVLYYKARGVRAIQILTWNSLNRSSTAESERMQQGLVYFSRPLCVAGVAQLVEQLTCNQQVTSSNLVASSVTRFGQVAKRSNATDCKSVGSCLRRFESFPAHDAGVTQLVESQPSKLLVAGSSPVSRSRSPMPARRTVVPGSPRLRSSVGRARPW
jgi:hypothetical protein